MTTSPSPLPQGLLKRSPHLTRAEFSAHYFKNHAAIVAPMFLSIGVQDYVQMHAPFTLVDPSTKLDVDIEEWDAVALIPPGDLTKLFQEQPQWKQAYYHDIILADERRFLFSEALDHMHQIPPDSVTGEKKVVIKDGKCLVEIPDSIWAVWREYEARGV